MPGDPLRFAASSLKKIRRSWNALRFFDRESYQEGFPSHHDVMNAGNGDVRDGKRPLQQYSWNSVPNQTAHLGITGAPLSKRRTSSPKSHYQTSEYLALPRARHIVQSPDARSLPAGFPDPPADSISRWVS